MLPVIYESNSYGNTQKKAVDTEVTCQEIKIIFRLKNTSDIVKKAGKFIVVGLLIWCLGYFQLSLFWIISGKYICLCNSFYAWLMAFYVRL